MIELAILEVSTALLPIPVKMIFTTKNVNGLLPQVFHFLKKGSRSHQDSTAV